MPMMMTLKIRYLLPLSLLLGSAIVAVVIVGVQEGYLWRWVKLAAPPFPADRISRSYYDGLYIERTDSTPARWTFWQGWQVLDGPLPADRGDMALGERPCPRTLPAFVSVPQPPTPYRDCVVGLQRLADGTSRFVYVIDAHGAVWHWDQTNSPYQSFPLVGVVVVGSGIGLLLTCIIYVIQRVWQRAQHARAHVR